MSIFIAQAVWFAVLGLAMGGLATGRLSQRQYLAGMAAATAIGAVVCVITHDTTWASVNSGSFAVIIWLWWQSGGGDDTKRRLRPLARRFSPVRRTAPSAS
ncbi:hypothetical protein ACIQU5_27880 [Streptomyces sp. NPDC090306]|uniref:hypothetical protein n=1 Tax=Streptomyces sp. NPDC090306 TaxID=3365961 RepID=UPI0038207B5A